MVDYRQSRSRWGCFIVVAVLTTMVTPHALADKKASLQHYKNGKRHFDSGNYKRAVSSFKKAYQEHQAPAYLFNLGQAYSKLGQCKDALDHYHRFLVASEGSDGLAVAKAQAKELEAECGSDAKNETNSVEIVSPAATVEPEEVTVEPSKATRDPDNAALGSLAANRVGVRRSRRRYLAGISVGPALYRITDVETPVVASLHALGALRFGLGEVVVIDAGLALDVAPMNYTGTDESGRVYFLGGMLTARGSLALGSWGLAGLELGVGDLAMVNAESGNVFTQDMEASGPIHMAAFRFAGVLDARIASSWSLRVEVALNHALRSEKLKESISVIQATGVVVGAAYLWGAR